MKRSRLSILGMMAVIVLIAVALAALRSPTILGASLIFTATVAFLATAVLGAIARRGRARVAWAGVAVFGWAYLAMSFGPFPNGNGVTCPPFPTQLFLEYLRIVRESADQNLSVQQPPWAIVRENAHPRGEAVLNAPQRAVVFPMPSESILPSSPTVPRPEPIPPTPPIFPYLDWMNQRRIGHSLGAILFGLFGALVGLVLARLGEPAGETRTIPA